MNSEAEKEELVETIVEGIRWIKGCWLMAGTEDDNETTRRICIERGKELIERFMKFST